MRSRPVATPGGHGPIGRRALKAVRGDGGDRQKAGHRAEPGKRHVCHARSECVRRSRLGRASCERAELGLYELVTYAPRRSWRAPVSPFSASPCKASGRSADPIIDIHQHLNYSGRSDDVLLAHQRAMGATTTILLPAGRSVDHAVHASRRCQWAAGGGARQRGAATSSLAAHATAFRFGANEVPDVEGATRRSNDI